VHGVVPVTAPELGGVVVPERGDRRRVGQHHDAGVVDDPHGQRDALEDRVQRSVGPALPGVPFGPA
jgi:hypothetical protein